MKAEMEAGIGPAARTLAQETPRLRERIVFAGDVAATSAGALRGAFARGEVRFVATMEAALAALGEENAWVLVSESRLGAGSGVELARAAVRHDPDLAALVLYEPNSFSEIVQAVREGSSLNFVRATLGSGKLAKLVASMVEVRAQEELRRADRRGSPRVSPPEVAVLEPAGAELVDLTPEGIAIRLEHLPAAYTRIPIQLRVSGKLRVECAADVVRRDRDRLGRDHVAARLVDVSQHARKVLQTVVRRQLVAQGPREMQRRFRESASSDVVPIAARARIAELLELAREEGVLVAVQAVSGGVSWKTAVSSVDAAAGTFTVNAPATIAAVAPGQDLDVLLQHEFESYLFQARLARIGLDQVECEFPAVVYYSEKRARARLRVEEESLRLAFPHPKGDGTWLSFDVLDVSAHGASFLADLDRTLILPGAIIDAARLTLGDRVVLTERAEVRHVTPTGEGAWFKIGVRYASERRSRRAATSSALSGAPPPAPAMVEAARHRAKLVRFLNPDGEELVALLNLTARHAGAAGPVVVIPPSWGFSKEAFSAYSLTLTEAFATLGQPAAVLRFDYSHHKGESYITPEHRSPGLEAHDFTLSRAVGDVLAAVQYCFSNPLIAPTTAILLGPSFSAPVALRAAALDHRIRHLAFPMGTPSSQELVKHASGGLDYFGAHRRGARFGVVDFLGLRVDMDRIAADAAHHRLAFAADAAQDLSSLEASVDWFAASHDGWVNPKQIERLLEHGDASRCELTVLDCGHLPTRDEGLVVAAEVARAVLRRLELDPSAVSIAHPDVLETVQAAEWARAPKAGVEASSAYWRKYLLGEASDSLGFDVFAGSDAYQAFVRTQLELLDLRGGERMLDAGGGTGQLVSQLLSGWAGALPGAVEIVDLVPEALERARLRLATCPLSAQVGITVRPATLEVSRLAPVQRFLAGEYPGIASLRGRIEGLSDDAISRLSREYELPTASRLHAAIRGCEVAGEDLAFLDEDLRLAVRDLGRAARLLCGALRPSDLRSDLASPAPTASTGEGRDALHAGHVAFSTLKFGDAAAPAPLALPSEGYDRIVCSLVLPYLHNPDETVRELVRALRPGGVFVASTMKPDLDLSKLHADLVGEIVAGRVPAEGGVDRAQLLEEVRAYSGAAAFLLRLTQEGTFRFLSSRELGALLTDAGLVDVRLESAFGSPAQAIVACGRKR